MLMGWCLAGSPTHTHSPHVIFSVLTEKPLKASANLASSCRCIYVIEVIELLVSSANLTQPASSMAELLMINIS